MPLFTCYLQPYITLALLLHLLNPWVMETMFKATSVPLSDNQKNPPIQTKPSPMLLD